MSWLANVLGGQPAKPKKVFHARHELYHAMAPAMQLGGGIVAKTRATDLYAVIGPNIVEIPRNAATPGAIVWQLAQQYGTVVGGTWLPTLYDGRPLPDPKTVLQPSQTL